MGGIFDCKEQLVERLRQGPGEEARQEMAVTETSPPPSRWTLRGIRATFSTLHGLTLGGVGRGLKRRGLRLRSGVTQDFSPDPEYVSKEKNLYKCLYEAASTPDRVALVLLDEMGYARWPDPACDWAEAAPCPAPRAERAQGPNRV